MEPSAHDAGTPEDGQWYEACEFWFVLLGAVSESLEQTRDVVVTRHVSVTLRAFELF